MHTAISSSEMYILYPANPVLERQQYSQSRPMQILELSQLTR